MKLFHLAILCLLATQAGPRALAQETAEAQLAQAKANEQRVRDTLRTTTQQLGAVEAEKATLLAAQTERDQRIAALEAQLASASAQAAQDREESRIALTRLTADGQRKDEEISRLQTTLQKWKAAHSEATTVLRRTEATRSRLSAANITLERTVAERERQNLALYATASEILQRYADFSLGRAIAAREPFTGLARARIEEQIQDYADKIQDSRIKPAPSDGQPSSSRQPAAAPAATPAR